MIPCSFKIESKIFEIGSLTDVDFKKLKTVWKFQKKNNANRFSVKSLTS